MTSVKVISVIENNELKECVVIPANDVNLDWGLRKTLSEIYGGGVVSSTSREIGDIPSNISRHALEHKSKAGSWIPFQPSWGAPCTNMRYLIKMKNNYVVIASYLLRVGGAYWKNDAGQEIDSDNVIAWRSLNQYELG